eukprot:CAMPEP_0114231922 /NCGR_PEP_ID=MMETSP0058-20121206/4321_1 /TAXON_ID=36894 /ORGANISM="Pyramimonas parkeae, CCMP726" /LENGTH=277 /DNA_ID=CAMNT_0001343341 /DNA_START=123 /DNA_END=956 /DNA_ORIENTATION=+
MVADMHFPALISESGVSKPTRGTGAASDVSKPRPRTQYTETQEGGDEAGDEDEIVDDAEAEGMLPSMQRSATRMSSVQTEDTLDEEDIPKPRLRTNPNVNNARPWEHLRAHTRGEIESSAKPIRYKELLHEYKHSDANLAREGVVDEAERGRVTRFGDIHESHAALHELAPESRRGYFKHVDQLARVGLPKHQLGANKGEKAIPDLTPEQHASLPRSTREYITHQHKIAEHPDKVARWEALNANAARKGWLDRNDVARRRGFRLDDSVTRRMITGEK